MDIVAKNQKNQQVFNLGKIIIRAYVLLLLFFSSSAQTDTLKSPVINYLKNFPPPTITHFPEGFAEGKGFFTTYDTDDGLAMDAINSGQKSTLYDSRGNLWFGTQGAGVSMYDGRSFTTYNTGNGLANNTVFSIIEDKSGNIWFGTWGGGVSKYDGKLFITYSTKHGLVSNYVREITEDKKGNLWFGTDGGGVSRFNGESFTNFSTQEGLSNNSIRSIVEDKKGNLWFGTRGGGVSKYDGKSFITYNIEQGVASNNVISITEDKIGNLWFGTDGAGVTMYDGNSFITYNTKHGLTNNFVYSIYEDVEGNLWFGTEGGGVSKFDKKRALTNPCVLNKCEHNIRVDHDLKSHNKEISKYFITYSTEQGLASNIVCSITEDKTGNLWFGTGGAGVSKYSGQSFTSYSPEHGLAKHSVFSIMEDKKGNLWFGTYGGGVSKYDGKSFITYTKEQGLVNSNVMTIIEDSSGNIWLGTWEGLIKYDGKSFNTFSSEQGLVTDAILDILEDSDGNLWFASWGKGLIKYDGKSFHYYNTEQGLSDNYVCSIIEGKQGDIWIGTDQGGVSKYDGNTFTTYNTEQGLTSNRVYSITEDKKGNLWIGTYGGGVSVLTEDQVNKTGKVDFLTIDTSNGLPDNGITGIIEDRAGNILIGTNFGLGIIPLGDLDNGIEVYNQFTGYPIRDVNGGTNNGALLIDKKGMIWIGTGSDKTNLVRFDYSTINRDNNPPKVIIQNLKIKNENVCWYDLIENQNRSVDSTLLAQQEVMTYGKLMNTLEREDFKKRFLGIEFTEINKHYPLPEKLVLPYKHNALTFEFNAIDTDRNFLINYRYMLDGQDEDWSPITKKNDATFNNISEGDYTFLLKAQSPWGVWSESITYSFTVSPPWYRTWWSYILYLCFFIYGVWYIVQLQTRKIKLRQEELEIKVDKATVEIRMKNEELAKKNKQKTAMLKEIHHRVKNNLQVVNSLLKLQSREFEDEHAIAMFKEAQNRVLSMALLHEKLYRSEDLKHINVQDHITLLVEDLVKTYAVGKSIKLDISIEEIEMEIGTLVPLGLIINEIITNSFKHAFKEKNEGLIELKIRALNNTLYEMIIGDDGIGLKQEIEASGIGSKLIQIFTKQLNGRIEQVDRIGTVFKLIFEKIGE